MPLPLDLTPLQMPGCSLLVSLDLVQVLAPVAGTAVAMIPIPAATSLVGIEFHHQALGGDPTANPAGLIVSHGATARVGSR